MKFTKRALLMLAAAFAFIFAVAPGSLAETKRHQPNGVSAPTANFAFDDGNGPTDAGSYPAGTSFTLAINLSFAPGGNVANLTGLSYWFEQQSPLAPFYFAITNRNVTGSQFTDLQSPGLTYPQSLTPTNPKDLGAISPSGTGVGQGTYFIANLTVSIASSAAPGTYIIENTTTAGGKASLVFDDQGNDANIPRTSYTITVVALKIASISRNLDNQDIVLQCNGVPNSVNRIEASPDLSPNSFQTIGSITPDASGAFSFEDTNPGTQRFYRIAFP